MKNAMKKLSAVLKKIFGWGILVSLLAGGLTFLGYVAALIVGGEAAGRICEFIYKDFMPVIIYATSCLVLLGLLAMYLNGEMALTGKKGK